MAVRLQEYRATVHTDQQIEIGPTNADIYWLGQVKIPLQRSSGKKSVKHRIVHITALDESQTLVTDQLPAASVMTQQIMVMDWPASRTPGFVGGFAMNVLPSPLNDGVLFKEVSSWATNAAGTTSQVHSDTYPVEELGTAETLETYSDWIYCSVLLTGSGDLDISGVKVTFYVVVEHIEISDEEKGLGAFQHLINRSVFYEMLDSAELGYLDSSDVPIIRQGGRPTRTFSINSATAALLDIDIDSHNGETTSSPAAMRLQAQSARTMVTPDEAFGEGQIPDYLEATPAITVGARRATYPAHTVNPLNGNTTMN